MKKKMIKTKSRNLKVILTEKFYRNVNIFIYIGAFWFYYCIFILALTVTSYSGVNVCRRRRVLST